MKKNERLEKHPPSGGALRSDSFIFLDARGKRWPRLRLLLVIAALFLFAGLILFARSLVMPSQLVLPSAVKQLKSRLKIPQPKEPHSRQAPPKPLWLKYAKAGRNGAVPPAFLAHSSFVVPSLPQAKGGRHVFSPEIRLGFYEGWIPGSFDSLQANGERLTHLCPDWLTLDDGRGGLKMVSEEPVLDLVRAKGIALLPLLRNMGENGVWIPEAVEGLVNGDGAGRERFVGSLIAQLKELGAAGVVVEWDQIDPSYREPLTAMLNGMAVALHSEGLELWLCVPMGRELNAFDLDGLAGQVDHFVAKLHDENSEHDQPGPIASHEWFTGWLETVIAYGEPAQWVLALGTYGYDWSDGEKEAETVRFQDVMSRAGRSSLSSCEFDAPTYNPHFEYEDSGIPHTLWFLDAVTFFNQLQAGRARQVGGVAISRLGMEDPGIWSLLTTEGVRPPLAPAGMNTAALETIRAGETIAHIGQGNFITLEEQRADGVRKISSEHKKNAEAPVTEQYERFPNYSTVVHQGRGPNDAVAITFDDGPDPRWTPQILDILKAQGVSATFFMIGANMEKHPDIVRRIVSEGHTVGIHTYTHPNIALVSEERASLEFNATQRLLEAITDRSTLLFRPPYNADTNPHNQEELVPVGLAQELGYITVTEDIDPQDWAMPGVKAMLAQVKKDRRQGGNVVLLHDAGGDRSQTLAALPQMIDYLRARGDRIFSLPAMLGSSMEEVMPPVPHNQQALNRVVSDGGFGVIHAVEEFFWAFMIAATVLVVVRTLAVAWLAVLGRRADAATLPPWPPLSGVCPPVSVLIAAYNEEKVILQTLRSLLNSSYPGAMEVVVVDDGSLDNTAELVAGMAKKDDRIRLVRQMNMGKAAALKNGLRVTRHEQVVCLDADTQFAPETISHLGRWLSDPAVGAVSGRALVGNLGTFIARFQSLEYTCGFNLDRRAYHYLNCITVVPGAVSAFKKSAVAAAGGISAETLAEDTDLTLSLHRCGYRVCYASGAIAWTEAPETIRTFARQRFRWAFGTLQCLWKHRDMLFDGRFKALAWFSLPSAWFFHILLVALGPVIDLLLLVSLFMNPASGILYFYFFVFLCADLLLAAVACQIEREPLSQIWLILPMRFIYRPVLSFAVLKAIVKASKGVLVGWGKLDRTATVTHNVKEGLEQ